MHRCSFPDGYTIKLDGVHDLDPCRYVDIEKYENVTVIVSRCKKCGNIDYVWYKQPNTVKTDLEQEEGRF